MAEQNTQAHSSNWPKWLWNLGPSEVTFHGFSLDSSFWASPKNSMRSVTVSAIDVFHNIDGRETVAQEGTERKGHPFATSCVLRNPGVPRR